MATTSANPSDKEPTGVPPSPDASRQPTPPSRPQSQELPVDGKAFYGYLYNKDKTPTALLDALLRAVGQYIIVNVGDTSDGTLDTKKLSAFYHAVGGDYDSLFVNAPGKSISYIWTALGVRHILAQPANDDFTEPSVPALTLAGFVRWQSLQILLGPEEHVPYMQYAVRNWALRHPDTGKLFPLDLPATAFPAQCDEQIDKWHRECAYRLRNQATPRDEQPPRRPSSDSRMHAGYAHVHSPAADAIPRSRPASDYFTRERSVPYTHVPGARHPSYHPSPNIHSDQRRVSSSSGSSLDDLPRRRSFNDLKSPPAREDPRSPESSNPRRPPPVRRHSHPRPYPLDATDSEADSDVPPRSGARLRPHGPAPPPPPTFRRVPAVPPPSASTVSARARRNEGRADDPRRMSLPAELKLKIASLLPGSSDRHRSSSREKPAVLPVRPSVRIRKETQHSRLSRSVSGESYASDESDPEMPPRHISRTSREHARAHSRMLEKEREREREIEEERERRSRKERGYLRPNPARRTGSHADADRRNRDMGWDPRDRERSSREFDRDTRRVFTPEERDRRDRERRRYRDRGPDPSVVGVGGRRYPRQSGL
ncbi:hypothetical protein F5Y15DRAFT_125562 [Xylariaceae sp. FL0016]|nr:hypothetical protein F5Y15DRAFT_125562 [Xylariaceae sp. FL0016]